MCLETELSEISNGAAISVTRASPAARRLRMLRRVSSASATRVSSRSMPATLTQMGECCKPRTNRALTPEFLAQFQGLAVHPAAVFLAAGLEAEIVAAHLAAFQGVGLAFGAEGAGELLEFLLERELA